MSQDSLETVGGGSHENQEAPSPERREHAERCHMLGAFKYTPKISTDDGVIYDLFPTGTLSIDPRFPAPSFDLPLLRRGPLLFILVRYARLLRRRFLLENQLTNGKRSARMVWLLTPKYSVPYEESL